MQVDKRIERSQRQLGVYCLQKSILINVGRGDLVSEGTIVKAIEEGWLGGAILDVFEEEPLPTDSRLWGMPQVIITPHTSALANIDDVSMTS